MATTPTTDYENSGPSLDGILLAEELLDLAERAQAYTNAAGVAIALRRGQDLLVRTSTGSAPDVGSNIPATDAFIADCLRTRRPLCCRDTEADGRVGPVFRALKIRSLIAVPICEHRDAKGVMIVISPVANAFQPTHTAILMTLSDIIASKLAARDAMPKTAPAPEMPAPPPMPAAAADPMPAPFSRPSMPAAPPPVAPSPAATHAAPVAPRQLEPMFLPEHAPGAAPHAASFAADSFPHMSDVLGASAPDSPADAPAIPADLLREAPVPLPEETHEEHADPGLLSPSEDPTHFRRPIAVSTSTTQRFPVMSVNITPPASTIRPGVPVMKPAVPSPIVRPSAPKAVAPPAAPVAHAAAASASAASSAPPIPVLKPMPAAAKRVIKPSAMTPAAPPVEDAVVMPAPVITLTPASDSWGAPETKKSSGLMLKVGSAAAALVVIAGLWMYMGATKEVAPPSAHAVQAAIPSPAMPATAAAPATTPKIELVSKANANVERTNEKPARSAEVADTTKKIEAPVKVIELAAGKPHAAPVEVVDAPKLALASGGEVVSTLSRLPVAMPSRPQSQLVPAALVSHVAPTYPLIAKQLHIYGAVKMNVTISTTGAVKDVKVASGPEQLQSAAVDAVKRWKYKPAMLNGQATESSAEVQVNFAR